MLSWEEYRRLYGVATGARAAVAAGPADQIVNDLATAALWRRGAAALLDAAIGVLVWVWSAMCVVVGVWGFRATPLELPDAALLLSAVVALGTALHFVYHVAFVGGCGQTPGRMAFGIAVVRRDGGTAGYGRALARCLGGLHLVPDARHGRPRRAPHARSVGV